VQEQIGRRLRRKTGCRAARPSLRVRLARGARQRASERNVRHRRISGGTGPGLQGGSGICITLSIAWRPRCRRSRPLASQRSVGQSRCNLLQAERPLRAAILCPAGTLRQLEGLTRAATAAIEFPPSSGLMDNYDIAMLRSVKLTADPDVASWLERRPATGRNGTPATARRARRSMGSASRTWTHCSTRPCCSPDASSSRHTRSRVTCSSE